VKSRHAMFAVSDICKVNTILEGEARMRRFRQGGDM
jgi:hypothetical protein